jgi:hypothetical protein
MATALWDGIGGFKLSEGCRHRKGSPNPEYSPSNALAGAQPHWMRGISFGEEA